MKGMVTVALTSLPELLTAIRLFLVRLLGSSITRR